MNNNGQMKLTLLLTFLGTLGIIAVIPYQLALLGGGMGELGDLPLPLTLALGVLQQAILLFLLTWIGLKLQQRTGLDSPILRSWLNRKRPSISGQWMGIGILVSLVGTILILILDVYLFMPRVELAVETVVPSPTWWQGLLAMLYGGITEEIMLRLFGMTLIVWLLAKLFRKSAPALPQAYYWIGIVLASVLFGIAHLPATLQAFGELSMLLVIRGLVLNGILGVWFGYLYWKRGLEYAIVAHMSADFFLHVVFKAFLS